MAKPGEIEGCLYGKAEKSPNNSGLLGALIVPIDALFVWPSSLITLPCLGCKNHIDHVLNAADHVAEIRL